MCSLLPSLLLTTTLRLLLPLSLPLKSSIQTVRNPNSLPSNFDLDFPRPDAHLMVVFLNSLCRWKSVLGYSAEELVVSLHCGRHSDIDPIPSSRSQSCFSCQCWGCQIVCRQQAGVLSSSFGECWVIMDARRCRSMILSNFEKDGIGYTGSFTWKYVQCYECRIILHRIQPKELEIADKTERQRVILEKTGESVDGSRQIEVLRRLKL